MTRFTLILTIFFLIIFANCNNSDHISQDSKQIDNSNEKKRIREFFAVWQTNEINKGHFFAKDSCNPQWFIDLEFNGTIDEGWGIPDSSEISFSYADLNNDSKLDGLVMFTPDQCDGGNASMWTQLQIFVLSDKDNYKITDTIHVDKFASTEFDSLGFYWLDSIMTNRIFGTYIEFKDNDGHCCPSINKPVTFDFEKHKLIQIEKNIERE